MSSMQLGRARLLREQITPHAACMLACVGSPPEAEPEYVARGNLFEERGRRSHRLRVHATTVSRSVARAACPKRAVRRDGFAPTSVKNLKWKGGMYVR